MPDTYRTKAPDRSAGFLTTHNPLDFSDELPPPPLGGAGALLFTPQRRPKASEVVRHTVRIDLFLRAMAFPIGAEGEVGLDLELDGHVWDLERLRREDDEFLPILLLID